MSYEVRFFNQAWLDVHGVRHVSRMGVGADQILWVEPHEVGVEPEHILLMPDGPAPLVLLDFNQRKVFVNVRAVAERIAPPELHQKVVATIDRLLASLSTPKTPKHDPLRNN